MQLSYLLKGYQALKASRAIQLLVYLLIMENLEVLSQSRKMWKTFRAFLVKGFQGELMEDISILETRS